MEIGKKHSPAEAKVFTDTIKQRMYALWDEKVSAAHSCAISKPARCLRNPETVLAQLVQLSGEVINNFHLIIYQRHQGILRAIVTCSLPTSVKSAEPIGQSENSQATSEESGGGLIKQETMGVSLSKMVRSSLCRCAP